MNFDIRSFGFVSDFGFRISSLTPRLKSLLLAWVTAVSFLGAGCAHLSPDLTPNNVAPLFHVQTNPEKENRRIDAAGPFYSQSETPEEREWGLRPFFWYRENSRTQTEEAEFLYPLGWYKKTPEERSIEFLPLYRDKKLAGEEDRKDYVDLFPFFWGRSKTGEPFGGFFPLGGVFKDRFVRDEITFVLWPLYTQVREGESETTHILWPVFSLTRGGEKSGYRIWPIYGEEKLKGEGAYEKTFFFWPIGHFQRRYLDTDNPKTYFYLFPLYLSERSNNEDRRMFLWPLFNYYRETNFDYLQLDLPWPVIRYARAPGVDTAAVWPLFYYRQREETKKIFLFWPLYLQDNVDDEFRDEVLIRFLLFSKIHQVYLKKEDRWERVTRIWPFFRHAEDGRGRVHFFFPALMPADWEGLERHYGLLFRVFDHYEDGQGLEVTKFLWGLFYRQKQKDLERIEVSFLFDWQKTPDKLEVNFLKGLWGYRREGIKKTMKLFYLPVPLEEEPTAK